MNDVALLVEDSDLVTAVFGSWPSFHDAEVLELSLNRSAPALVSRIVVASFSTAVDDAGYFIPTARAVLTFVFSGISDLVLEGCNHQNVIGGLMIERTPTGQGLRVSFDPIYGLSCDFDCERARVENVGELAPTNEPL